MTQIVVLNRNWIAHPAVSGQNYTFKFFRVGDHMVYMDGFSLLEVLWNCLDFSCAVSCAFAHLTNMDMGCGVLSFSESLVGA